MRKIIFLMLVLMLVLTSTVFASDYKTETEISSYRTTGAFV